MWKRMNIHEEIKELIEEYHLVSQNLGLESEDYVHKAFIECKTKIQTTYNNLLYYKELLENKRDSLTIRGERSILEQSDKDYWDAIDISFGRFIDWLNEELSKIGRSLKDLKELE